MNPREYIALHQQVQQLQGQVERLLAEVRRQDGVIRMYDARIRQVEGKHLDPKDRVSSKRKEAPAQSANI